MKTVLNKINVDTTQQPLFLGEDLALQRYDKHKYPVFFDLFKKQLEQMWRPEEISLLNDRASYQMLSDAEKFIFTSNLKFQTMLDSVIARGIPTLQKYISNPELEACFNTWQLFETIHSYSYTYIIKNVYADPGIVFDNILTDQEIIKRAYSVCNEYDKLIDFTGDDIKKQIYLTLMSINILEGVRFYVSFVCSFAFGHNGKMVGNADIIKLIRRDEACVDKDTQILTENGWINLPDLKDGVKVAQYHKDGTIDFIVPSHIIRKPYKGDMVSLKNQTGHIDMLLTPDHRVVYRDLKNKVVELPAEDFNPNHLKKIIVSGNLNSGNRLSDYEKLLIAIQADGTIRKKYNTGSRGGTRSVSISLKKERKQQRLIEILDRLNFQYTKSSPDKHNRITFYIKIPKDKVISKLFSDWVPKYDKLSLEWCLDFIEEIVQWDGSIRSDTGSYYYSSTVEQNVIVAQTIASLCGYKTYKSKQVDNRKDSYKDIHRLSMMISADTISGQCLQKNNIPYDDMVYCVTVPSGMFIAKRNDGIFVTGNCHMSITQNLIKILQDEKSEGFKETAKDCKDIAIEMFRAAAQEEKEWANYIFQHGSILGINEEIISQYIEWLTDTRMANLRLPKIFNTKNPIGGWIEPWMQSESVQVAPQEHELTSYKISASVSDIEDMDFSKI